jgi:hypothetical protein
MLDDNQRDDDEIISRRQDELEALQAFYGHQLRSSLPSALSSRSGDTSNANANDDDDDHDEVISLNGPWFIELIDISNSSNHANNIKIPTLEIRLPPHYPLSPPPSSSQNSSFPPTLILHHVDNHHDLLLPSLQKQALIEELMEMYEPEMDMAIMWAERCREEFLDVDLTAIMSSSEAAAADANNCNDDDDVITTARKIDTSDNDDKHDKQQQALSIRFLTFNHLLYGKSHKKESQIVSLAGKLGLIGFIVYGTPGIIGLLMYNNNSNDDDEDILLDFAKECSSNRIGKRATILDLEMKFDARDGELLSSPECDNDVVEAEGGGRKNDDNNNGGKKIASEKKSKSKGGSGNNNSNSDNKSSTGESSRPLLANLLGADRVTVTNDSVSIVDKNKSGLRHFDSIAELKEVLPNNSGIIQSILGL